MALYKPKTFLKSKTLLLLALLFLSIGCAQQPPAQILVSNEEAYFCPEDNCAGELIQKIDSAQKTIDVAIYSFTLDQLADALIEAKNRGVLVRVLFDSKQSENRYSEDERLAENGIEVKIKRGQAYMHNKIMIVDSMLVATGSFNYSQNANTENDENLVFLDNPKTVKKYEEKFEELWQEN